MQAMALQSLLLAGFVAQWSVRAPVLRFLRFAAAAALCPVRALALRFL
jgi:hypothetical protein